MAWSTPGTRMMAPPSIQMLRFAPGKKPLRARWAAMLGTPGFSVDWQLTKVEVSRSGDLAWQPEQFPCIAPNRFATFDSW